MVALGFGVPADVPAEQAQLQPGHRCAAGSVQDLPEIAVFQGLADDFDVFDDERQAAEVAVWQSGCEQIRAGFDDWRGDDHLAVAMPGQRFERLFPGGQLLFDVGVALFFFQEAV